nr:GNAT family N-acetyltransferase [Henriciella sp.]
MEIRPYRPDDEPHLFDIFQAAIRSMGARHYSPEQIEAWAGPRVSAARLGAMYGDGRATFIAVDEKDKPVAFSDMEADGHVDMLYCHPAQAGRGVASLLLAAIDGAARQAGLSRLHAEASETARPVFERAGYRMVMRRDFEIEGVAMHNWKMEKQV